MLSHAVFSPLDYWIVLATFLASVAALLAFDFFVIERLTGSTSSEMENDARHQRARFRVCLVWTVICVALALGTAFAFRYFALSELTAHPALLEGTKYAELTATDAAARLFLEFVTSYLVEISLSIDNLFVFLVIFRYFGLTHERQHRVLFWGIVGAVVFRAVFIGVGSLLVQFEWVLFAMGVFLIVTGTKLVTDEEKQLHPEKNPFIRMLASVVPVSLTFDGTRFFTRLTADGAQANGNAVKKIGRLAATPLFVALIVIETTDIAFAVDSVPAVLAISQEPFVAFGSNICAIIGLRAMFFVVAEAMQKFHLLKYGLGFVLVWVGLKMTALPYLFDGHVPIVLSLSVIVGLILATMALSLIIPPKPAVASDEPHDAIDGGDGSDGVDASKSHHAHDEHRDV